MPSWFRRISAGFTTSTVPFTVSIIAPPGFKLASETPLTVNHGLTTIPTFVYLVFLKTKDLRLWAQAILGGIPYRRRVYIDSCFPLASGFFSRHRNILSAAQFHSVLARGISFRLPPCIGTRMSPLLRRSSFVSFGFTFQGSQR